jgi:hypothetical protein
VVVSKVAQRREAKITSIVEAAWSLARERGIQLVSLRDLAEEVGMQQPSLYAYFDSKNALYDAMFADGNWEVVAPSPLALRSCETQVCPRPNSDLCASPRGRSMECGRGRSHPPKLQRESAPRARPIEWATRDLE